MVKRILAAFSLALMMVPFVGSAALAGPGVADTGLVEKVECLFRVYINEGGESGLDCLT